MTDDTISQNSGAWKFIKLAVMKFTIIVSTLVMIAVLLPGSNLPDVGFRGIDKLVHVTLFAAWAIAVRLDTYPKRLSLWRISMIGLLFSLFTEFVQIFTQDRTFDLADMVADVVGLALGLLFSNIVIKSLLKIMGKR